ncbi:MAG: hypothetical protein HY707_03415 [Ignavibacteriae bacterium]|nr:hypothetical protein [Ignavibacteriota bacterium]
MILKYLLMVFIYLPILLVISQAQSDTTDMHYETLKLEVRQLRHELDSLQNVRTQSQMGELDEFDQLEERLERRLTDLEKKIDAVARSSAPIVLNPRTTAFINFAARVDDRTVYAEDQETEIGDRPFLRTLELDLRAPVDPYAEAISILAFENEAGESFEIDVEEAYGLIKRLPIIEAAPLGMKLKIGKFRAPLGVNNKLHMHDLPWTTRPLVVSKYLGTEQGDFFESGFNPTGVDIDFFLPSPIPQTTLEMNLDVVRTGELGLSQNEGTTQLAYLSHLTLSKDWSNEHLLVVGGSVYYEREPLSTRLLSADITYKWLPSERRQHQSFVAGGEIFWAKQNYLDTLSNEVTSSPYGWFWYLQYQTSYWLYVGVRYDWLKEPIDDQLETKSIAGYLSYYTTEFLRFRIGVEHRMSDIPAHDDITSGIFEVNFVFGSHPTEPYWVNR